MPKIDSKAIISRIGAGYPPPFQQVCAGREKLALGNAAGLTQFGVNLTTIPPGGASSLAHWHAEEDELVFVLAGEVVLVEGGEEILMLAGDAAGFKAGVAVGHCLENRSCEPALILEVGSRSATELVTYPGRDLLMDGRDGNRRYTRVSGDRY